MQLAPENEVMLAEDNSAQLEALDNAVQSAVDPIRFVNRGKLVETKRFTIGEGYEVEIDAGAESNHEDLVLKGGILHVLNGSKLNIENASKLESGTFIIGSNVMGRALGDTPITTVTTELDGNIGASVQVRAGGELRLGNDAYESAVQAGAIFKDSAPKLIISQPITLTSAGSLAVGADISAEAGGAAFGKDSQFVVNFAQLSNAPAITGQGGNLVVEPGAEIQVNVTGIQKGRYLITRTSRMLRT